MSTTDADSTSQTTHGEPNVVDTPKVNDKYNDEAATWSLRSHDGVIFKVHESVILSNRQVPVPLLLRVS